MLLMRDIENIMRMYTTKYDDRKDKQATEHNEALFSHTLASLHSLMVQSQTDLVKKLRLNLYPASEEEGGAMHAVTAPRFPGSEGIVIDEVSKVAAVFLNCDVAIINSKQLISFYVAHVKDSPEEAPRYVYTWVESTSADNLRGELECGQSIHDELFPFLYRAQILAQRRATR